ncbi:GMC oxidoreductase [Acuticoccus sediminis]|uniref:GMC oxidoreductase n=1 Tax=Acuticoccus sediminis TaxID=2184697 RepID=UPI001CFD727D|nr:GMC family oxidoreductase [Acuticoccus sediminis]
MPRGGPAAAGATVEADVVVVGAGACGAAATWRLATSGVDVVCVEAGAARDAAAFGFGADDYGAARSGPLHENPNVRRGAGDLPVDDRDSPIKASVGNAVGGTTLWWAAHIPRFREEDFRVRTLDGVAHDWPIAHADLARYYAINERVMGLAAVPGDPAGPDRAPGGGGPGLGAPPRTVPTAGPVGRRMARAFDALGWHHWPVELSRGDSALCTHARPCDAGCPARVASGADRTYMAPAIAAGARLLTGHRALTFETGPDGRVTALVCGTDDGAVRVRASRYVLAAGGVGTPRLLLMSGTGAGLANRSGLVGRNLMLHPHARVDGLLDAPVGSWTPGQKAGLVCLEFLVPDPARGFPRGFKMQLGPGPGPAEAALPDAVGGPLPWGTGHHAAFASRFDHVARLTICAEDLPEAHNRVTLSDAVTDRDGYPAAKMTYRLAPESRAALDFAIARAEEVLRAAGARAIAVDPLKAQAGFHLMGTARMGNDRETSVTDRFGRCHDVSNLFLADSSVFVTGSAMNPTSTAQALALRTADHIVTEH